MNEHSLTTDALLRELKNIDVNEFPALCSLAEVELLRLRGGIPDIVDIISDAQVKVRAKIDVPQGVYPGVNFVGRLLGPGGQTLRSIQETTKTKLAILGAGSSRDENKEKELLASGDPKYQHLKQKLHLQVDTIAPPAEAYYRLSYAVAELRKAMLPVTSTNGNEQWQSEPSEFPAPPWSSNSASFSPHGGAIRGGRPPLTRGSFSPQGASYRGRGKPWGGRGSSNGAPTSGPPPVTNPDMYSSPPNPVPYPNMPVYDKNAFQANTFEEYPMGYGNDASWGKIPHTENRGRGRTHPYARPGMKSGQQ